MAVRCVRNLSRIDGLAFLVRDFRHRHDAFHRAHVRQLRCAQHDVTDRVHTRLTRFQPFVDLDKATVRLDFRLFQTDVLRAGLSAYRDQDFLRLDLLRLALDAEGHGHA